MSDIQSPIDFCDPVNARLWAEESMLKRPYRKEIFGYFVRELKRHGSGSIIELGSGPGFLIKAIMSELPSIKYTALDFSAAMHQLARERLAHLASSVEFVLTCFKEEGWQQSLAAVDAVISLQAVHELRHKNHAANFFCAIKSLLNPDGIFLFCDHVCDSQGMSDDQLFMTETEQHSALTTAGFRAIEKIGRLGSLAVWKAVH